MKTKKSLQKRILSICLVTAILSTLIMVFFSYHITSKIIREKVSLSTLHKLETVAATIDQRVTSIVSFMDSFSSTAAVNSALTSTPWRYTYSEATLISTFFKTLILENDNLIDSIISRSNNGKLYMGGNGLSLSLKEIDQRIASYEDASPFFDWKICLEAAPNGKKEPEYVLSLYYALWNTTSHENTGYIYTLLRPDQLMKNVQSFPENRTVILTDENMNIIYNSRGDFIGAPLAQALPGLDFSENSMLFRDADRTLQLAVHTVTDVNNWHLIETEPYSSVLSELDSYIFLIVALFLATVSLIILLSVSGTRRITRPLREMEQSMIAVQNRDYSVEMKIESDDEIGRLAATYNVMLARIKKLIQDIYDTEQKKRETELQVLQAQINPHFLYNTLNSIHWMAVVQGMNNISDMVSALVQILQYSLGRYDTYTTLRTEVEMLEPYLFIQNVRFGNGITFSGSIPPEYEDCIVPRLILQPLVENCISHGLRSNGGRGMISIGCHASDGTLYIEVSDNGTGFPHDIPEYQTYESVKLLFPSRKDRLSIGLENTHNRIRLFYGEQYGLSVQSESGKGAKVRIAIPCQFQNDK